MRLLLILALIALLGPCTSGAPAPRMSFEWLNWSNAAVGYCLDIPDVYEREVEEGG